MLIKPYTRTQEFLSSMQDPRTIMSGGYESVTYFVILITYYIMSLDLFGLKIHEKAKSKYEKHMKIQFYFPW